MNRKQFLRYIGAALGWAGIAPLMTACTDEGAPTKNDSLESDLVETEVVDTEVVESADKLLVQPAATLTPAEIAGLKFMREEEKLAHDVYVAMYTKWNHRVFYQIAQSETKHTEAIRSLLVKYSIPDPAAGLPAGVYSDPALQALYNSLIAMGNVSVVEALKVGALIEETDIRDINAKKAETTRTDILRVYTNLICGSQDHLRAFNRNLLNRGVTYVPQVITQAQWNVIVSSTGCVM